MQFNYLGHMATYNRQITDVREFMTRLENFSNTHNFIEELNNSNQTHTAGHNQFSDWSHAEF